MNRLLSQFFSLLIALSCFSCNVEKEPRVNFSGLDSRLEKYVFGKKKYWIFENDSTGLQDSIEIINTKYGNYRYEFLNNEVSLIEYFQMDLKNFSTNLSYNYRLSVVEIKRDGGGDVGEEGQLIYSCLDEPGYVNRALNTVEIHPSLTINGNIFNNVTETKVLASQQLVPTFKYDTYHYFSDNVGIVKTVIDSGNGNFESWSLKRWGYN